MQSKAQRNEMQMDFDDDVPQEEIIDEEELVLLKEMKDLKRDYRDNYGKLKGLKEGMNSLQANIDASKEQMIFQFENWYANEFEADSIAQRPITLDNIEDTRNVVSQGKDSTTSNVGGVVGES